MTPDREITHTISSVTVEVSPDEVDAGAELTLKARVSCSPALDLTGQALLIKDHDGAVVGSTELIRFEDGVNATGETVLKAPAKAGTTSWSVVCPARVTDGITVDEVAERFAITVKPHATRVVVWDVPSTAGAGEKFRLKVGIKCSSGCRLAGRAFAIVDDAGGEVATGRVGDQPWPESAALHFAEVEVAAPVSEGLTRWAARAAAADIKVAGSDVAIPHDAGDATFGVRVVPLPQSLIRVRVIDRETQGPLTGVTVVMHPYRAVTDASGWAEMRVANGPYELMVSRAKYLARALSLEVTEDVATTAELDVEPEYDPSVIYQ